MAGDNKNVIVYQMKYEDTDSWAYFSNFLYKFQNREEMEREETEHISTLVLSDTRNLVSEILMRDGRLRPILKPENLYEIAAAYDNVFNIYIETAKLTEIIDLQKLYLIYRGFENLQIYIILKGENQDYYRISRFFEWTNEKNRRFYNSISFCDMGKKMEAFPLLISRQASYHTLLPLLEIDKDTDHLLREASARVIGEDEWEKIFSEDKIHVRSRQLGKNALSMLQKSRKKFVECPKEQVIQRLKGTNLLTMILFSFFLEHRAEPYRNIADMDRELYVLKKHVQSYLQLTENILFHTRAQVGVFSFRLLEGHAEYIQKKYELTEAEQNGSYFEIGISDYPGGSKGKNLAETFLEKLENDTVRTQFANLKPVHFFQNPDEMDDALRNVWDHYYDDVEHTGKHYGLKIFAELVKGVGGKFLAQSHSSHQMESGDSFGGLQQEGTCMPGTAYSILMPLRMGEQYSDKHEVDYGISNEVLYETDLNTIRNIQIYYDQQSRQEIHYEDESEKSACVEKIARIFTEQAHGAEFVVIDAGDFTDASAELLYKALIKSARMQNDIKYVAICDCNISFIDCFWEIAYSMFKTTDIAYSFRECELQIVLYAKKTYEELVIVLNDYKWTVQLNNQINFTKETRWKDMFLDLPLEGESWVERRSRVLPFDVMVSLLKNDERLSIFELYAQNIISQSIQGQSLGCKFEDTHMRLGSTIHVGQFYEAEILFGANLFVDRFSLLMALDLQEKLQHVKQLTLYGYASYSEQLIFKMCSIIKSNNSDIDVDYVILERETKERGSVHVDKIRYSRFFESDEKRREYFKNRKLVCIVPISSTLKTNERLINLFCESNGEACRQNVIEDYEVILVGNKTNDYWEVNAQKRIESKRSSALLVKPKYFIRMDMHYEESMRCRMCFPDNVLDEIPLIEVNAASTIPNQAFGIRSDEPAKVCSSEKLEHLEQEMSLLKDSFLYSHTKSGDAHFLFYVQSNLLMVQKRAEIEQWLRNIKNTISLGSDTYDVIFCPAHARNVGFAECINENVFQSSAIIIRDDIDKEYRSNFAAKYSNIYLFIKKIAEEGSGKKFRFFYADDAILTGRSFQRAKSLIKSIVKEFFKDTREEYSIFDSIFVLVDRNSADNRKMYVGDTLEKHFFAFCTLHVSSLRNHGDACVLCNLENDAKKLKKASVGTWLYSYWREQQEKFAPDDIEKFKAGSDYNDIAKKGRAYRRLVCANEIGVFLSSAYHGNSRENALQCTLQLLITGCDRDCDLQEYRSREEMQREYFLSYCKILSRPFIVFNKAVKEAVFDLLLLFTERILTGKELRELIADTSCKSYWNTAETRSLLLECDELIQTIFIEQGEDDDLLQVLLKELTELKSNYIIRLENIHKIVDYVVRKQEPDNAFYDRYVCQVKRLLGVSSDTSKSAWFDYLMYFGCEVGMKQTGFQQLPDDIYEQLYIENNRVISDAIEKLSQRIQFSTEEVALLNQKKFWDGSVVSEEEYKEMDMFARMQKSLIEPGEKRLLESMREKIVAELDSYTLKDYKQTLEIHVQDVSLHQREEWIPVAAQILLNQYIKYNFGENGFHKEASGNQEWHILTAQCRQIAIYLNYILRAEETYLLVEAVSEPNVWEDILIERFNRLAEQNALEAYKIQKKEIKEYLLLGNSADENGNVVFRDKKLMMVLKNLKRDEGFAKKGYAFLNDEHNNSLIWKLGMRENQVYVCSRLAAGRKLRDYLHDIRNTMQFSYQLNQMVFNVNNTEFFLELVAAAKNLSYSLGRKVLSHTPYMTRMQQYQQIDKSTGDENADKENRRCDLIMLLADLNISEHYRDSLRREYYIREGSFTTTPWGTENPVFRDEFPCQLNVPIGEMESRTEIVVYNDGFRYTDGPADTQEYQEQQIDPANAVLCYDVANPGREAFLMLYLLVTNSAVKERCEKSDNKISVYLSKTAENELRISSKLNKNEILKESETAEDALLDIPPFDEEGISIWSLSRYLKSYAATVINGKLKGLEAKERVAEDELAQLKEIMELLPDKVRVKSEEKYVDGEKYFTVVVPILAEKYKNIDPK